MLIDVTLPQLGESLSEGTISKWLVREGDAVQKDQPIVSIATDKADSEIPSHVAGRVAKVLVTEGQVVAVKTVLARIEEGAGPTLSAAPGAPVSLPPASKPAAPPPVASGATARSVMGGPLATPMARKTALENEVDLDRVQGTGDRGRVTK